MEQPSGRGVAKTGLFPRVYLMKKAQQNTKNRFETLRLRKIDLTIGNSSVLVYHESQQKSATQVHPSVIFQIVAHHFFPSLGRNEMQDALKLFDTTKKAKVIKTQKTCCSVSSCSSFFLLFSFSFCLGFQSETLRT